jgi:hypothetical protein
MWEAFLKTSGCSSLCALKGVATQFTKTLLRQLPPQLATCTFILIGLIKIISKSGSMQISDLTYQRNEMTFSKQCF